MAGGWRQSDGNKGIKNGKAYEKNGGQNSRKTTRERLGIVNFRCIAASLLAYKYLEWIMGQAVYSRGWIYSVQALRAFFLSQVYPLGGNIMLSYIFHPFTLSISWRVSWKGAEREREGRGGGRGGEEASTRGHLKRRHYARERCNVNRCQGGRGDARPPTSPPSPATFYLPSKLLEFMIGLPRFTGGSILRLICEGQLPSFSIKAQQRPRSGR